MPGSGMGQTIPEFKMDDRRKFPESPNKLITRKVISTRFASQIHQLRYEGVNLDHKEQRKLNRRYRRSKMQAEKIERFRSAAWMDT